MSSSPPPFLVLPPQLKLTILDNLDGLSLVRMGMTCKQMRGFIYANQECSFKIEMAEYQLRQRPWSSVAAGMPSRPPSFLDIPDKVKFTIFDNLDVKFLLRMGMTCKWLRGLIDKNQECNLKIEMAKCELLPSSRTPPPPIAHRMAQLQEHRTSRLTFPIDARLRYSIIPPAGPVKEKLFQGLFVCISGYTLRVWDIRRPGPPQMILMISETGLLDVVIAPEEDLLILLCYHFGNNSAIIKFFTFRSNGTQPHPRAASHLIRLPEQSITISKGLQFLTLHGPLLALVYNKRPNSRRGIIWDWKTGNRFYDSMDFDTSNFHDLVLLTSSSFLVIATTASINGPPATFAGWIELRSCRSPAASSRLVAEFHLPAFDKRVGENDFATLQFHSSEPQNRLACAHEDIFPFFSDWSTSVQILHIHFTPKPEGTRGHGTTVYLAISHRVFAEKLAGPNVPDNDPSSPLSIEWKEWGPTWTSIWQREVELISGMSSVCGSRFCSVFQVAGSCVEVMVVDFNMNFPCTERNCTNAVHWSPKLYFSSEASLWAEPYIPHTFLPFHTERKRIKIGRDDDDSEDLGSEMCVMVLMDEERIVLSTRSSTSRTLDPTRWRIIHMLRETTSNLQPCGEHIQLGQQIRRDEICRMCRDKPHTDAHILFECTPHNGLVQVRQNFIEHINDHYPTVNTAWDGDLELEKMMEEIKALRLNTQIRILLSSLVTEIRRVYDHLHATNRYVEMDEHEEDPAGKMFSSHSRH